jgi:polyisoprenoid-binding protein YceI
MTTIVSDSAGLDGHLKNEDFFDVENHPEATIAITSTQAVSDEENGDYVMATADLTIKDITNTVTFPIYSEESLDVAKITIDRTLWDIRYGSNKFFDDLKDKAIKDEIDFEVNIAYVL